jgi:hypothetical protein
MPHSWESLALSFSDPARGRKLKKTPPFFPKGLMNAV